MRERIKKNSTIIAICIAFLGSMALNDTLSFKTDVTAYSNSFVSTIVFLLSTIALISISHKVDYNDKRGEKCSLLFSALLSFALIVGKELHTVENCNFLSLSLWINMIILIFYFMPFTYFLLQFFKKNSIKIVKGKLPWSWKGFLMTWLILLICWLPVFLAFYPGAFVYDAQDEYIQVASRGFTTHHPLLHVLLLGGAVCFGHKYGGSYNTGIAMYIIFQMVIIAAILAYSVQWFYKRFSLAEKTGKIMKTILILFYGFFPIFPMYAVCSAKDSLFNAFLFLTVIFLIELFLQEKESKEFQRIAFFFILSAGIMLLLRRNAVYAFVLLILAIFISNLFLKRKGNTKKILLYMFAALLLYMGAHLGLEHLFHASDEENQELLTVPIQQMARTYKYDPEVFSDHEKEILYQYIAEDVLKIYDADLSDLVKASFNNKRFSENRMEFLGLWLETGMKKPLTFLNAWLMTSYGYWYPDTIINVYGGQERFTFQYRDSSYFGFETEEPGKRESKFPWLEEQYRKISLEIYQQRVPVLSMLFSPGFLFWVLAFAILNIVYKKMYSFLLPMGLICLVWGTFLLGPTFLVRYVLILWFVLPLNVLLMSGKTNDFS